MRPPACCTTAIRSSSTSLSSGCCRRAKRVAALPDVPTIAEAGVRGYEANNWWGILVPAGTPGSIVDRLHKELSVILSSAETQKLFLDQGAEIDKLGPAEFGPYIAAETTKWGRVIKEGNIKAE